MKMTVRLRFFYLRNLSHKGHHMMTGARALPIHRDSRNRGCNWDGYPT